MIQVLSILGSLPYTNILLNLNDSPISEDLRQYLFYDLIASSVHLIFHLNLYRSFPFAGLIIQTFTYTLYSISHMILKRKILKDIQAYDYFLFILQIFSYPIFNAKVWVFVTILSFTLCIRKVNATLDTWFCITMLFLMLVGFTFEVYYSVDENYIFPNHDAFVINDLVHGVNSLLHEILKHYSIKKCFKIII